MKSLKQSRIDRIRRLEQSRLRKPAKMSQIVKEVIKEFKKVAIDKCPHKIGFRGAACFICNADKIADSLRDSWREVPTYKAYIFLDDVNETSVTLNIKTDNPTQKLLEMQENGFWYVFDGRPIFMMPGQMKVVRLDDRVRNPLRIDLPKKRK